MYVQKTVVVCGISRATEYRKQFTTIDIFDSTFDFHFETLGKRHGLKYRRSIQEGGGGAKNFPKLNSVQYRDFEQCTG